MWAEKTRLWTWFTYSKELSILFKKLGQVTVPESSDQNNIFIQTWISSLQRSSHNKHRLDCSHTKVIMILLRELFAAQSVHLDHLSSKVFRRFKAFRVQNYLSNQGCKEKDYSYFEELYAVWFKLTNLFKTYSRLQRGFNFPTAYVMYVTAMIHHIFISSSVVHK